MTCKECVYYYSDGEACNEHAPFGTNIPYCHFKDDEPWLAPCEMEDDYPSDDPQCWADEEEYIF